MNRKVSSFIIAILACLLVLASCADPDMHDQTGNVRFLNTADQVKSLNRVEPGFDAEELYWMYEAEKISATELTTGVTEARTFVSAASETTANKGLSQHIVGPFSLGNWNFKLYGYSDNTCKTLVYSGEAPATIRKGVTNSIRVAVSGMQSVNGQGYLTFPEALQVEDQNGKKINVSSLKEVITYTKDVSGSKPVTVTFADGNRTLALGVGGYLVTVSYIDETTDEVCAANSVYVNIYDNLTSSYVGTVDENTGDAYFDASAVKTDVVTQTADKTRKTVFEVAATPETTATSNKTVLSVPEGKLEGDVKATVTTYSAPAANKKFDVIENDAPLAALDITITDSVGDVTDFKDHPITITTYIASGLGDKNDIKVKHDNGLSIEEIIPESYDNVTGELVFKVTHLSEYFIVSENVVAINMETNKGYDSLKAAVEDVSVSGHIVLLKDADLIAPPGSKDKYLTEVKGNTTLDLNGHSIEMDRYSTFGISDNASFEIGNGTLHGHGRLFDIRTNASMIIQDGIYITENNGWKSNASPMIFLRGQASLLIEDGQFTATNREAHLADGVTPADMPILQTNGSDTLSNTITINGGVFNGNTMYFPSNGVVRIKDGEFNGDLFCIYQKCGELHLEGGHYSTKRTSSTGVWQHNSSGANPRGDAITVEGCNYPSGRPSVFISSNCVIESHNQDGSQNSDIFNYPILIVDWLNDNNYTTRVVTEGIEIPYYYAELRGSDEIALSAENVNIVENGKRCTYVSATAVKSGDGSKARPVKTIAEAVANTKTDIVYIEGGEYAENITVPAARTIELIGNGTAVTNGAQVVTELDKAADLSHASVVKGKVIIGKNSNVVIDNLVLTDDIVEGCLIEAHSSPFNLSINDSVMLPDDKGRPSLVSIQHPIGTDVIDYTLDGTYVEMSGNLGKNPGNNGFRFDGEESRSLSLDMRPTINFKILNSRINDVSADHNYIYPVSMSRVGIMNIDIIDSNIEAKGNHYSFWYWDIGREDAVSTFSSNNSRISGWCPLYVAGSRNITANIKDSYINGFSNNSGPSDGFGTLVIENSQNVSINLSDSTIKFAKNGEAEMNMASINGGKCDNNEISFINCVPEWENEILPGESRVLYRIEYDDLEHANSVVFDELTMNRVLDNKYKLEHDSINHNLVLK